jgi:hypothetical protein
VITWSDNIGWWQAYLITYLSSRVIIQCNHLMLSHHVVITCYHHLWLSLDITSCWQQILSSHVMIMPHYHLIIPPQVMTTCLSSHVITPFYCISSCCHPHFYHLMSSHMLSSHVITMYLLSEVITPYHRITTFNLLILKSWVITLVNTSLW